MPPLSLGHCWLVQIEIVGGPLCQPVQSACFEEQSSLRSVCFICPVLWPTVHSETPEPCLGCFAVFPLLANRKKSHTEQSREIKHGTSSLVIRSQYQVNTRARHSVRSVWRQLLTARSFRGQHACFAN